MCPSRTRALQVRAVGSTSSFLAAKAIWAFQNMSAAVDAPSVLSNRSFTHHFWRVGLGFFLKFFLINSFGSKDPLWSAVLL